MTATVDIRGVSHRFGHTQALSHINLSIEAGSFAVLLGPSGCGKTTLLSVLGGFITPDSGSVMLDNKDVTDVPPALRATTTMFQDYALFPHMNLQDNVGFGLRMRGISKAPRYRKAQEFLSLVGLEESLLKKPHELSGGQRQRVALARALAVDPDVLLLDEPLGALDLKLRRQMQDELKAIQRRIGTTFVHVTHDQEEAMAIADNIIVMNNGEIEDTGPPESIYLRPKTAFAAAFMGEANLIGGIVTRSNMQSIAIQTDFGLIQLPASADINGDTAAGQSVVLSFRPEHVVIADDKNDSLVDLGKSLLINHAFFGSHQRCQLKTTNGKTLIAHLPQDSKLQTGQTLAIQVSRTSVVLLRSDSKAASE